jgi:hypothetical protein
MAPGMTTLERKYLPAALAAASVLATCAGCSNTTPRTAVAPMVAFASSAPDGSQACSVEGVPEVVAAHVMPMAGVTAGADGSRVWLRFATKNDPRAALALDPSSLEVQDDEGATRGSVGATPTGTASKQIPRGPVAVNLEGGRQLVAWTGGSVETDLRVRAVTIAEDGATIGVPIDLGYEGSAIGRPALAVTSSGRGVLAFEESNGAGFHLVVTRVVCRTSPRRELASTP